MIINSKLPPKIFIIEGLDRCGKSTLVNMIREQRCRPETVCMHAVKPPKSVDKSVLEEWSNRFYDEQMYATRSLARYNFDVIHDRAHLGEYVYGHLYRGRKAHDTKMFHCERYLRDSDIIQDVSLVVLIDRPENLSYRSDGLSISDNIADIQKERERFYAAYLESSIQNKILVDWSEDTFEDMPFDERMTYLKNNVLTKITEVY